MTFTDSMYWIAYQSADSSVKLGMLNRSNVTSNFLTAAAWGTSPVGLLGINALYLNGVGSTLPTTLLYDQTYGHRDDAAVFLLNAYLIP